MDTMGMDRNKGGNQLTVDRDTQAEDLRELADDIVFRIWGETMGVDVDQARNLDPVEFAQGAIAIFFDELLTEDGEDNPVNQTLLLALRLGIIVGRGAYGTREEVEHA